MNLQIVSDSVNKIGGTNYTNDFTMSLKQPINAENTNVYIEVLSVSYPLTTKNVLDDCFFTLDLTFEDFRENEKSRLKFSTGKITLPDGIYSIRDIIDFLNLHLSQFDITLQKERNGKVAILANTFIEYWFTQYRSYGNTAYNGKKLNKFQKGNDNVHMIVELTFSDKLKFILGLWTNRNVLNASNILHGTSLTDRTDV